VFVTLVELILCTGSEVVESGLCGPAIRSQSQIARAEADSEIGRDALADVDRDALPQGRRVVARPSAGESRQRQLVRDKRILGGQSRRKEPLARESVGVGKIKG